MMMMQTVPKISLASDALDVAIIPHPFATERVCHKITAGLSIAQIIAQLQPDSALANYAHVYINGDYVPRDKWHSVTPKPLTIISIRMVPMGGGGGKNPLRTILTLAVLAVSPMLAGTLTGMAGAAGSFMGMSVGKLITTGINLMGRLAINANAPPARARFSNSSKESQTLFIQGARNQAVPFGRVPKILGRHRTVPPLGALPYTETVGQDQYLRMLFVWGYGPLEITDLKIGETPLSEFDDVEIETRQGYNDDAPITLYSSSVLQNDLQVTLTSAAGFITRTTETDADEISVDITLPRGLFMFNDSGSKNSRTVALEIQYSPTGMNSWSAGVTGYKPITATTVILTAKPPPYINRGTTYRVTRIDRIVMDPSSGAYKLVTGAATRQIGNTSIAEAPAIPAGFIAMAKIERRSDDADIIPTERITDERNVAEFGGIFETSGSFIPTSSTANRIAMSAGGLKSKGIYIVAKKTAALRKSVAFKVAKGQYDVRVRRITADSTDDDVFDETVWTALRTLRYSNPLRMQGLAVTALRIKATDQLNGVIDRFNGVVHSILPDWNGSAWLEQATSNPASLYRHVLQGRGNARPLDDTRIDLARLTQWHDTCAAANREFNAVIDFDVSVHEVLHDIAASGRASPALVDGKWGLVEDRDQSVPIQHFTPRNSYGFQGRKAFNEQPHGLRVRFINRDKGFVQDERLVFDDNYTETTATKYDTLELHGVTSPEQAWKDGRYHIATARLRPETYSFVADLEHIVCTRGDLIRLSHDVPMFGLVSARVKGVTTASGNIIAIDLDDMVSMESGKSYAIRFRKSDGSSLVKSVLTYVGDSQTLTFQTADAEGPAIGDLAMFGESGLESAALIVKSIEAQSDLSAKITCVDASPAIHLADTAAIPDFRSNISLPSSLERPPAPTLDTVQSGEESLIRHTDGSFTTRIVVTLNPPAYNGALTLHTKIRAQGETSFRTAEIMNATVTTISITDVEEDEIYDITLQYKSANDILSAPLSISGHKVMGTSALPSDVADLSIRVLGDTAHLSWSPVRDIDLHHSLSLHLQH